MRSNTVNIWFLSLQSLRSTSSKLQSRSALQNEAQVLPKALIPLVETLEPAKEQTLNTYTKRGRPKFMRFSKMPTSRGQKREIYWWFTQNYKRIIIGSLKKRTQKLSISKMDSHPLFIERRRNPQISSKSSLEIALIRLSVDRPNGVFFLVQHRFQFLCMLVGRTVCRTSGIELQKLYPPLFLALSLQIPYLICILSFCASIGAQQFRVE